MTILKFQKKLIRYLLGQEIILKYDKKGKEKKHPCVVQVQNCNTL